VQEKKRHSRVSACPKKKAQQCKCVQGKKKQRRVSVTAHEKKLGAQQGKQKKRHSRVSEKWHGRVSAQKNKGTAGYSKRARKKLWHSRSASILVSRFTINTYSAVPLFFFALILPCPYFFFWHLPCCAYPAVPLFFYALTLLYRYFFCALTLRACDGHMWFELAPGNPAAYVV